MTASAHRSRFRLVRCANAAHIDASRRSFKQIVAAASTRWQTKRGGFLAEPSPKEAAAINAVLRAAAVLQLRRRRRIQRRRLR